MSGDIFDIDQGDKETISGTLHDRGATPGDVLTVQTGGAIAAAPGGGGSQPFAFVTLASEPGYTSTAVVPFDTVIADADGFFDAANHQFVIPAGRGGVYLLTAFLYADGDGADLGPLPVGGTINGSFTGPQNISAILDKTSGTFEYYGTLTGVGVALDGETISAFVSWSGLAATATLATCQLSIVRLGDAP